MRQTSSQFARIEQTLWRNRFGILILGGAFTLVRMWWLFSPLSEQARYPVREMLVNSAGGFVRRAISGDIILTLSNIFGGAPTVWATIILTALGSALFWACIHLFTKLPDDPTLTPLVLAPWGLLFMAYDVDLLIRKEAFGYLALCCVLIGAQTHHPKNALRWLAVGCVIMPTAILIHEVNTALAGPMIIAVGLLTYAHPHLKRSAIWIAVLGVAASTIAMVVVTFNMRTTPEMMCAALDDQLCEAPFSYFGDTLSDGHKYVMSQFLPANFAIAVVIALAAALPFAGIRPHTVRPITLMMAIIGIILCVLPLFVFAADYGRWIALITLPASLLTATALSLGIITYHRVLPHWAAVLYCGTWSIYHYRVEPQLMGWQIWGFLTVAILLNAAINFLRKPNSEQTTQW